MNDYIRTFFWTSRPVLSLGIPILFLCGFLYSGAAFGWEFWTFLILFFFPGGLVVFGLNDVYDYESDRINARKQSLEGHVLEPKYHSVIIKLSLSYGALMSVLLFLTGNLLAIVSGLLLLVVAWVYSVPPLRLKTVPFLDSFADGSLVLLTALLGFSFGGSLGEFPTGAFWLGLAAAGVHTYYTMMDYSADKHTDDMTISVFLGKRWSLVFGLVCIAAALLFGSYPLAISVFLVFLVVLFIVLIIYPSEELARRLFWLVLSVLLGCTVWLLLPFF